MKGFGKLVCYVGPMFSGKSSALVNAARQLKIAGVPSLMVKYDAVRYSLEETGVNVTHNSATWPSVAVHNLSQIPEEEIKAAEVILVDEAQFYPDLIEFCQARLAEGKTVHCAALNMNFAGEPWQIVSRLAMRADELHWKTATCTHCKGIGTAVFTHKKGGSKSRMIEIGGADKYEPLCRACFIQARPPCQTQED